MIKIEEYLRMLLRILLLLIAMAFPALAIEITPYKFTPENGMPAYEIPVSSRYVSKRSDLDAPDIVYYLSKPKASSYPIIIVCGGSSNKEDVNSIIHVHRYFLQEFLDLGVGVLTVEQWGVDGGKVNAKEFMSHYTRSQRLKDHKDVITHLEVNPPNGWNGKFIFMGISEGGPLVTSLTTQYPEITIATINWSGAGDWSWREELWAFVQKLRADNPECMHKLKLTDCSICATDTTSRKLYDARMNTTLKNPVSELEFFGMTYKYHADSLTYPKPEYYKIRTPFLVVAGGQDTIIHSSDAFVQKAKNSGANITYLRIEDMDHYVRKRPEVVRESFKWLKDMVTGFDQRSKEM